jgi:DNA-binding response OmpR family regulator
MPKMDGYETVKILKSRKKKKNIPVIFLAETGQEEESVQWEGMGVAGHIMKPFDASEFINNIENILVTGKEEHTKESKGFLNRSINCRNKLN